MNAPVSFQRERSNPSAAERRALAARYTGAFAPASARPLLTDEETAVAAAAGFAREIRDASADREIETIRPLHELERASALGLTSLFAPRSHGGPEAGYRTLARVVREIAKVNPSVAQILIAQYTLGDVFTEHGTAEQKDYFLPRIVAGARIANALAEARTKSAADDTTRLRNTGEGEWRLDGEKFYTTGAFVSHWFPVLATDETGATVYAVVARDAPGLVIHDGWRGVGQRATVSGTARFDSVKLTGLSVIRPNGPLRPHSGNTFAQFLHAAVDAGIAAGALDEAVGFLNESARAWPEAGVERAAQDPHTIRIFGELKVLELAADALIERAARALQALRREPEDAALQSPVLLAVAAARAAADEAALRVSCEIFALGGARASLEHWNPDRFWRNARTHTVHDPIRWRHHAIGDYHLNGVVPPDNARAATPERGRRRWAETSIRSGTPAARRRPRSASPSNSARWSASSGSAPRGGVDPAFVAFTNFEFLGAPVAIVVTFLIGAVFFYAVELTPAGRAFVFMGQNAEVARLAGVNVRALRAAAWVNDVFYGASLVVAVVLTQLAAGGRKAA